MSDTELARLLGLSAVSPPKVSTAKSTGICEITEIEREWCSHCTGATTAADDLLCRYCQWSEIHPHTTAPIVHDGRHGKSCKRCVGHNRKERNEAKLRL